MPEKLKFLSTVDRIRLIILVVMAVMLVGVIADTIHYDVAVHLPLQAAFAEFDAAAARHDLNGMNTAHSRVCEIMGRDWFTSACFDPVNKGN